MIKINVMRTFLNRLKDRGWKKINFRGLPYKDTQVLGRGDKICVIVESINVDASVDIRPQINELFKSLIDIILRADAKEIFLPGGGDIHLPDFFSDFCREHGIHIHLITLESFNDYINYN